MMRKITAILLGCFAFLSAGAQSPSLPQYESLQKMNQFMNYLGGTYVDEIDMPELVDAAIVEMLSKLDPHSAYVTKEEMKDVRESFNANFDGIGIEFNVLKDTIIVVNTIPGGPSERVGLLPNDRIVSVADSSLVGIKQVDVPKILRGPKGTSIDVGVVRHGVPEVLEFHIVRDKIPIYTVDAAYKVNDQVGYVKVNRFAATTNRELQEAIAKMGPIQGLILDLRGNGGGYLDQAVYVSNNFLQKGSLVVSTEGRVMPPEELTADKSPMFGRGRLIVLVDEFSASASEIVAGAVQDWDRGIIIGRPTFGKGLVQRQFPLNDGSAVRITVARYHTPSGRVIQRPYEKGKTDEYYAEFNSRFTADSLASMPDSLKYTTLRSKRTVYGGGGITPDVIVERDTTTYSDYWANLVRRGVINEYVIDYMDKNRSELERDYANFEAYDQRFEVTQQMIDDLVALATAKSVTYVAEEMAKSDRMIRRQLKALIAQKLWTTTEYFRVINDESDEEFAKAMEVMNNWATYAKGIKDS